MEQVLRESIGKCGDRQRGIGSYRSRHDRAICDHESRVTEHASVAIDDTRVDIIPHCATPEGMDGDHLPPEMPEWIRHEVCLELVGERLHGADHPREVCA